VAATGAASGCGGFDADDHGPAAEDLGGEHLVAGQGDDAAFVDGTVDLDGADAGFDGRQRRRPGRDRALPSELREVGGAQV
jgi:hypothetical protein